MKQNWYETGKSFQLQKKAADKKHQPMYMKLKLKAAANDLYYAAGPIDLTISAGSLERCKRLFVSDSLISKLALGTVYRVSGANSYMEDPRILVRLRWQDSKGYFGKGKIKADEPMEEHIFAIPEDVFLKGAYCPAENRKANDIAS
jgi:hypothetical protein